MLEIPFAANAVVHVLSGKAYARAVRAHLLVNTALNAMLLAEAFQAPQILFGLQEDEAKEQEEEIVSAIALADMLDISSGHQELGEMLHEDLGDATLNAVQNAVGRFPCRQKVICRCNL